MNDYKKDDIIDFGPVKDTTKDIIKVVGVGGGGCNAVANMYKEGMESVRFAVCNTDSKSLSVNPVPTKIMLGKSGLGAGADPEKGRQEAESNIEDIRKLFDDTTQMVFITASMGGGTGTGAGPLVAKVAREMGKLTIGIVTIPFYFERRPKIIKALKGLDEMRSNVDALLIINNEQICKVYSDSHIAVNEALQLADKVMGNAVRSISELITLPGKIQTDFADVRTTMRNGGGAIMSIGRASGEHRVRGALLDALKSPLLYGSDISKATRILFNIYTSKKGELYVDELNELDVFMDELDPNIDVIYGLSTDDTLDEDVKITILATGFDNSIPVQAKQAETTEDYSELIDKLYGRSRHIPVTPVPDPPFTVELAIDPEEMEQGETVVNGETYTTVGSAVDPTEDVDSSDDDTTNDNITDGTADDGSTDEPGTSDECNGNKPLSDVKQPTVYKDPAKSFLNRVLIRIKHELEKLTKPDEE